MHIGTKVPRQYKPLLANSIYDENDNLEDLFYIFEKYEDIFEKYERQNLREQNLEDFDLNTWIK